MNIKHIHTFLNLNYVKELQQKENFLFSMEVDMRVLLQGFVPF